MKRSYIGNLIFAASAGLNAASALLAWHFGSVWAGAFNTAVLVFMFALLMLERM